MFGTSRSTRVDEFPVDLTHFCDQAQYEFGDKESILASFTLAGYFSLLNSKPWHTGARHLSPMQSRYGLVTLSHGSASRWKFCASCLARDRDRWGMGYWRRCHQLPGTLLCPLDGTPLSTIPRTTTIQRLRFILPDDLAPEKIDGQRIIEVNHPTLMRIALLNSGILWHHGLSIDIESLLASILAELKERGLTASNGRLLPQHFWRDFQSYYAGLGALSEYSTLFDPHAKSRIAGYLERGRLPCSSMHTALVIDYLFGSWEAALEHCNWNQTFKTLSSIVRPTRRIWPSEDDVLHKHRAICLDLLNRFPALERNAMARAAPRSFRWLLAHDTAWLTSIIPCHRRTSQRQLFPLQS
jgi:hypothetical protein